MNHRSSSFEFGFELAEIYTNFEKLSKYTLKVSDKILAFCVFDYQKKMSMFYEKIFFKGVGKVSSKN